MNDSGLRGRKTGQTGEWVIGGDWGGWREGGVEIAWAAGRVERGGSGEMEGEGSRGTRGVKRLERMFSTFDMKKEAMWLHCSCEPSDCGGVWGLRRWLTVEKSCLELPGLLLYDCMMWEWYRDRASLRDLL